MLNALRGLQLWEKNIGIASGIAHLAVADDLCRPRLGM